MRAVHIRITDCGLIAYQRIQSPFTHGTKAYKNKLSFDIKGFLNKEELTPYEAMNVTSSYPI